MTNSAASVDDDDDLAAIPPPGGLCVGSVCRLVKKSTSKAFNRAASAASDADAVARFLDLDSLSSLPVFANARAGLWHVDPRNPQVQLCRFKSMDGHAAAGAGGGAGGGSFPLSRLNLNVAAAAAAVGGAVIVDATRKGKRFPDALSRTVPIWAAVVNRACRIWGDGEEGGEEEGALLQMPPMVPASERAQVAEKVEGWARLLLSTGVDLSAFAAELSERPLVPVWVSRRGGGEGGGGVEVTRAEGDDIGAATTPLYLFSASDPSARRATVSCGCRRSGDGSSRNTETKSLHPTHGCFDLSFDYEPGGGDDEEGWSRGLSARLFWEHRGELLSSGPGGFEEAAEQLVRRSREGKGASVKSDASARPPAWSFVCGTRLAVGNAAAAAAAAAFRRKEGLAPAVVIVSSSSSGSGRGAPSPPASPHLCFRAAVPTRKKLGLLEALSSVVAFASAHLLRGRDVLLASGDSGGGNDGEESEDSGNENAAAAAAAVLLACFSAPPRAELLRAFGGENGGDSPPLRPCGCPAPPRASREEVRARIAAVCGSAAASAASAATGKEKSSPSSPPLKYSLPLSVGKEAAKQLLMFASPPERPGGFACPACRAGRPARVGWERATAALGEEQQQGKEAAAEGATEDASGEKTSLVLL